MQTTDPTIDAPPATTLRPPHLVWSIADDRRLPALEPYADRVERLDPETTRTTLWDTRDGVLAAAGATLETVGADEPTDVERDAVEFHLRGRDVVQVRIVDRSVGRVRLCGKDGRLRAEVRDVRIDDGDPATAVLTSTRVWELASDDEPGGIVRAVERALTAEADQAGRAPESRPEPPDRTTEPGVPDPTTAADLVVAALQAARRRLERADPAVRTDADDAIHTLRTAIRRTRSVLTVFRGALDPDRTDALEAELAAIGRIAGTARDAEVLGAGIRRSVARAPVDAVEHLVIERLELHFDELRDATAADVRRTLADERWYAVLDALDALIDERPPGPGAGTAAADFAAARIRHERRRLRKRVVRASTDDLASLHDVRKAARRLRYGLEALGRGIDIGPRHRGVLEKVQETLGDALDARHAATAYRDVATHAYAAAEDTFGYGAMAAAEHALAEVRIARYRHVASRL